MPRVYEIKHLKKDTLEPERFDGEHAVMGFGGGGVYFGIYKDRKGAGLNFNVFEPEDRKEFFQFVRAVNRMAKGVVDGKGRSCGKYYAFDKKIPCCLCGLEIEVQPSGFAEGHNAMPVTDGRACDSCNATKVVPARLKSGSGWGGN